MSELNTPYEVNKTYSLDGCLAMASIVDCNGVWFIDCFEADALEIVKRLNDYQGIEQELIETNEGLEKSQMQYGELFGMHIGLNESFNANGKQLLEAKAKIDDLHIHLEVAAYQAGIEMSDNHKSFVALHDSDVIESLLNEFDCGSMEYVLRNKADKLRKEGDK